MPADMNQTIQEASLDNLHDILLPDVVGLFPLAPGWIMVGILLLSLLLHFVFQGVVRYKQTGYKREALREIARHKNEDRATVFELLALARRVAIAGYGRHKIAGLSGESWWNFMEQHSKVTVNRELRETIATILYEKSAQGSTVEYQQIRVLVKSWVETHKVSLDV